MNYRCKVGLGNLLIASDSSQHSCISFMKRAVFLGEIVIALMEASHFRMQL